VLCSRHCRFKSQALLLLEAFAISNPSVLHCARATARFCAGSHFGCMPPPSVGQIIGWRFGDEVSSCDQLWWLGFVKFVCFGSLPRLFLNNLSSPAPFETFPQLGALAALLSKCNCLLDWHCTMYCSLETPVFQFFVQHRLTVPGEVFTHTTHMNACIPRWTGTVFCLFCWGRRCL
jgi:hypothetical protein